MFASQAIWWSFFQIWLINNLHFTGSQVGIIYSFNSAVTLILMFVYGIIQDRLKLNSSLLIFCATLISFIGPFFSWIYLPILTKHFAIGVLIGALYIPAAFLATAPLTETYAEKASRQFGFDYGKARAWGSLGYALATLIGGFMFPINPTLNFWSGSVLGVLFLIDALFTRKKVMAYRQHEQKSDASSIPTLSEMLDVAKMPTLYMMIILTMFTWTFYTVFDQQMFPQFYTSLFTNQGTGEQLYGVLNSVQVFGEAIMMVLVPFLMHKIGVKKTLLLGITVMIVRIGLCGIADTPLLVSLIKMLHSIEVPLFMLSMFRYFTLHFNNKLSATLYMVGFQIAAQVGQVILSTPLGILRDTVGYHYTFLVISAIVLCALIFALLTLKKDNEDVYGTDLAN
ncbi:oligosaccharide MFS transporter [Pediococcus pentosaceus]|nr:galactoside permease [Pediococcus pentosaceus]KQB82336.1 galactoside permease [Pediococcus pentosaceus]MBM9930364.1 oligosaccharide MFS transporter [Pediococcus pentosaceus]